MKERGNDRIELLSADETVRTTLIDLSTTGAAMNWPEELTKDGKLKARIRDYVVEAIVIYSQPRAQGYRCGIHFVNVPTDVQNSIKVMVDEFSRGVPVTFEIIDQDNTSKA